NSLPAWAPFPAALKSPSPPPERASHLPIYLLSALVKRWSIEKKKNGGWFHRKENMSVYRSDVFLAALAVAVSFCAAAPQAFLPPTGSNIDASLKVAIPPEVRGSSGAHAQMLFLVPFTNNAVFLDNYHPNFGNGIDLETGDHAKQPFTDADTGLFIFGTEYNLDTNRIRALHPVSNTFCSAGAFFPNGTLFNTGGAEPCEADGNCFSNQGRGPVKDGFDKIRTFAPGPCPNGRCSQDWIETGQTIQRRRWYHSMQTMTDGSLLLVGGANKGGLVLNEASINEANYEIIRPEGVFE
ncbi:MAG: glyoxal oxidase N-terminus-domain-containing protein, partial [Olpidium bornovanus]